ncbi:MAG TPA: RDD family protein [Thermoanaerobaculaceae bacterium]|nr:RDD family protein [Thermoanaerobaculaceae bacterium]
MAVPPTAAPAAPAPAAAKADLTKRFLAALIDGLLAGGVSLIPFIGGLIGAAYILVRDGLEVEFMDRRSIGKKVMKLRPVRLDGQAMDVATSVKRSLPLCIGSIGMVFWIIPILGWLLAILLGLTGLVVGIIELVLVLTDPEGRRMGDKFAGTKVVEVAA